MSSNEIREALANNETYQAIRARLAKGGYASADEYYGDKEWALEIEATIRKTTVAKMAPMSFWFGRQSN